MTVTMVGAWIGMKKNATDAKVTCIGLTLLKYTEGTLHGHLGFQEIS